MIRFFCLYFFISFTVIFAGSGISKFVMTKVMTKEFPALPKWFWIPAGLYEISFLYLLWTNKPEIALPMAFAFLGGVFCTITVLKSAFAIIPVPLITTLLGCVICQHLNQSLEILLPSLAAGFVIGLVLSLFGGSGKKEDKKK